MEVSQETSTLPDTPVITLEGTILRQIKLTQLGAKVFIKEKKGIFRDKKIECECCNSAYIYFRC